MIIYTAKSGDTLYNIGRKFGVTTSETERFNGLYDPDRLSVGQDVLIPISGVLHTVSEGESLYSIASHYGVTLDDIKAANRELRPPYTIYPGQVIAVPDGRLAKRTISVNGYAYPSISEKVLQSALPYLTYLSVFSYSINPDGSLVGADDTRVIAAAKAAGVAPIIVITNTDSDGFNGDTVRAVLESAEASKNLIGSIISTAVRKGYSGINIDFEYLYADDRGAYNEFLKRLSEAAVQNGLILSTALAPKLSSSQAGRLYEAHDYAFHGSTVDYTVIMTYEWGYLYGPPMAVAPYTEVKRVLSYAVSEIPSEKILMGMPNYGYDWTLPFEEGRPARVLTINGAERLAYETGSEIKFSNTARAPFFGYERNGAEHIVWFENARSTAERLGLINDLGLGGVSYWTINNFYEQNWRILSNMFNIRKLSL